MLDVWQSGSSPQMRGARGIVDDCQGWKRIIPADAGSTYRDRVIQGDRGDHPRRCGEHMVFSRSWLPTKGSSPQMRGAPKRIRYHGRGFGIIPADAGSTGWRADRQRRVWDHPRRCGEHHLHHACRRIPRGSSPQMRGARFKRIKNHDINGIIPADAGSTALPWSPSQPSADHPRRCGEHRGVNQYMRPRSGSSPQMRGAPLLL